MVRKNKKITAAILIIGNEILSGRTKDQNVSYLASWLNNNLGIKTEEVRIIPDIEKTIIKNISTLRKKHNYVLTTGGIGLSTGPHYSGFLISGIFRRSGFASAPVKFLMRFDRRVPNLRWDRAKHWTTLPWVSNLRYFSSLRLRLRSRKIFNTIRQMGT